MSQAMQVKYKDWKCTAITVTQQGSPAPSYTVKMKTISKPQLTFRSGASDTAFATTSFHALSSKIDIECRGQSIQLKPKGLLRKDYTYNSPAFGGQTVTWSSHSNWKSLDYVFLDQNSVPVARYTTESMSLLSWSKLGRIEFLNQGALDSAMVDEIVVIGLTLAYQLITAVSSSAMTAAINA